MRNLRGRSHIICGRAAMVLLCVLMADCCIFGAGRVIAVGAIGFRMALLFALLLVSLPLILSNLRNLLRNPFIWMLLAFLLWLVICGVIGLCNGNSTYILAADLKGFAYFALLPAALCILTSKKRIHALMKTTMYAAFALALLHVAYLIVYLVDADLYYTLYCWGIGINFSMISSITSKIPRLFFHSEPYLLCGCAFSMYSYVRGQKKPWYPVIAGLCLFAILLSYTRSVFLGAGVAAIGCVLTFFIGGDTKARKRLGVFLIVAVLVLAGVTSVFSITQGTDYFGFAVSRTLISLEDVSPTQATEPTTAEPSASSEPAETESTATEPSASTEPEATESTVAGPTNPEEISQEQVQQAQYIAITLNSDQLRAATIAELIANIKASPITGNGLGAGLEVRGDGEGFNEYFYLDLLSKTGIIGLILYLLPVLWMVWRLIRERKQRPVCKAVWLSVLLGFMAFSYFNPYMNASLGVLMYCCVMAVFAVPAEAFAPVSPEKNP